MGKVRGTLEGMERLVTGRLLGFSKENFVMDVAMVRGGCTAGAAMTELCGAEGMASSRMTGMGAETEGRE